MPYKLLAEQPPETAPNKQSQLGFIPRTAGRTVARAGETLAGLPGDILSAGFGGLSYLTGSKPYSEIQKGSFASFPTSQQVRENVTQKLTGKTLEPQGAGEELWDEVVSDLTSIFAPSGLLKGKIPGLKVLGSTAFRSTLGNLASWAAEDLGAGPLGQAGAKIGTMALASTLGGRRALTKKMGESYKVAEQVAENATTSGKRLKHDIDKLVNEISRGDKPDKKFVLERLNAVQEISNKQNPKIADIWELKRNMNEHLGDYSLSKNARAYLKRISGSLNQSLSEYAKENPKFGIPFYEAEDIFQGLNSSNLITKFLDKYPSAYKAVTNPLVRGLLGAGTGTASYLLKSPALGVTAGTGLGLYSAARQFQLLKSPTARKYYKEVASAALNNDKNAFIKSVGKLDKIADQYEKKNPSKGTYKLLQ